MRLFLYSVDTWLGYSEFKTNVLTDVLIVYRPCNTTTTWAGDESYKSDFYQLQSPMAAPWCLQDSTKAGGYICDQWIKEERGRIISTQLCAECCYRSWALLHSVLARGAAENLWNTSNNSWKGAHRSTITARYSPLSSDLGFLVSPDIPSINMVEHLLSIHQLHFTWW